MVTAHRAGPEDGPNVDLGGDRRPATEALPVEASASKAAPREPAASGRSVWKSRLPWLATAALAAISILLATGWWQSVSQHPRRLIRLGLQLGIKVNINHR